MDDLTVAEFREKFPEFSTTDNDTVSQLITEAYVITDVSRTATLYCIAHLAALMAETTAKLDGGSGVVKSETIGPRKIEYMTQATTEREAFFAITAYGRRVLRIESRTPRAVMSVVVA